LLSENNFSIFLYVIEGKKLPSFYVLQDLDVYKGDIEDENFRYLDLLNLLDRKIFIAISNGYENVRAIFEEFKNWLFPF